MATDVATLTPENEAALLADAPPPADVVVPEPPATPLQRLRELPPRNKIMLGAGLAGLLAVVVALSMWNKPDPYAPLFTGSVSEKDAGAAVAQLSQLNVPYKVLEGGRILVPADKAGELRMKLAAAGLPKGTINGFELLDKQQFGQSQNQERTTLQRALEGELTRTIGTLSAVESARVHLAMPQQNGFYREQIKPSASVVLTLHPGRMLDRNQVAGVVHLVSSSVPDLAVKAVSVLDQQGNLLSGDPAGDGKADLTLQQRQHVASVEATYLKRVNEILEPALGKDNLRATVTADIDFSESEQASESYGPNQKPESGAVRSLRNLETSGNSQLSPTGVPGAASNQPPTPASAPMTGASAPLQGAANGGTAGQLRRENQVNYEVDKTVRNIRNQGHAVKRVNVAVLVNHRQVTDAKGKTSTAAPPPEEIEKLTALVQEAVGYSKERGDSVKVESLPFRIDPDKLVEPPLYKQPWLLDLLRVGGVPAALTLVALLLVFGVIRPALKKDEPPPEPEPEAALDAVVDGAEALPGVPLDEDGNEVTDLLALEGPKIEARLVDAREMARNNSIAVANILRAWMVGEEPDMNSTTGGSKPPGK